MIIPLSEEKQEAPNKSSRLDEESTSPDSDQVRPHPINPASLPLSPTQSPPPYSSLPQGSSVQSSSSNLLPPDLAPTNYLHVKEKNNSVKRQILLDLSVPRPPAVALPDGVPPGEDTPHLMLDSHNGSVSGEVWVLRSNPIDTTAHKPLSTRERVNLLFRSRNGSIKALVVRARHLGNAVRAPGAYELFGLYGSISIRRW